jgi:hypothetical protein
MNPNDPTTAQPATPQPAPQPAAPQAAQPQPGAEWAPPTSPAYAPVPSQPVAPGPGSTIDWGPAPTMPVAAAAPTVVKKSSPRRRDPISIILGVAVLVAVGGVAFAAGRVTAPAPAVATRGGGFFGGGAGAGGNGGGTGNGGGGANGGGAGGGAFAGRFGGGSVALSGTVTEVASDHITLQVTGGGTITIPIDSSTTYHSQAAASASDVASGAKVLVQLTPGTGGFNRASPNPSGGVNPGSGNGTGGAGRGLGSAKDITVLGQ